MNRVTSFYRSAKERAQHLGTKAAIVGTAMVPGFAFASGGGGFDPADVQAQITSNTGIAVGIVGLMILGVWSLRSMGLLKGRG